jgi:hypothetical protein
MIDDFLPTPSRRRRHAGLRLMPGVRIGTVHLSGLDGSPGARITGRTLIGRGGWA